jgi:hypothetical protein
VWEIAIAKAITDVIRIDEVHPVTLTHHRVLQEKEPNTESAAARPHGITHHTAHPLQLRLQSAAASATTDSTVLIYGL